MLFFLFQAHSSCLSFLPNSQSVCQFGQLEPIFLPPSAISIPRTQLAQQHNITKGSVKDHPTYMQARKFKRGRCLHYFHPGDWHNAKFLQEIHGCEIENWQRWNGIFPIGLWIKGTCLYVFWLHFSTLLMDWKYFLPIKATSPAFSFCSQPETHMHDKLKPNWKM